ncbi:MAG: hypothetical protein MUF25_13255, partial [Pirellulaceae bacterium]|nr:hypothetical protein [Pirellulaceae bacterium]
MGRIARDVILFVIRFWASLRLTVVLFALAILLIFIGTLAQVTMDMWEVISLYFRAWLSWIDVKVLFPVSWFPNMPEQAMRAIVGTSFLAGGLALAIRCAVWRSGTWGWRIALGCVALLFLFQTSLVVRHGAFWFPGGATIGTLLALNLLAAHLVRFKVQARGLRLLVGLVGVVVGAGTTWVVISSGHN